jgi:flavin reductase (DIM6/NTAB) family NADH-FMN oxidoreductase RutF
MISLAIEPRADGSRKDTLANILESKEFVIHVAPDTFAEMITATSNPIPKDQSEWDLVALTPLASTVVRPPRISNCPVALECRLVESLELGASHHTLIIGEVLVFHIANELYEEGQVNVRKLNPIARLSGDLYSRQGEVFEVPRRF